MGAFYHCQFFSGSRKYSIKVYFKIHRAQNFKIQNPFLQHINAFLRGFSIGWEYNDNCYWGHCPSMNKVLLGEVGLLNVFLSMLILFCFLYDYAYEQPSLCLESVWYGTPIVVFNIDMLISIPKFNLSLCITVQ